MKRCAYNLPAKMSLKTAAWLCAIFLLIPGWPWFPLSEIFGIGIILYYIFRSEGENELGLSLNLSSDSVLVIIVLISATVISLIGFGFMIDVFKAYAPFEPELDGVVTQLHCAGLTEGVDIDRLIYPMFAFKRLLPVLYLSIKPLLTLVVFAPVFESIVIFAILFPVIFRKYGFWRAILITALVFAGIHHYVYIDIFAFGFIFTSAIGDALLYVETRSLYPTIVFHACWNFILYIVSAMINWGMLTPPPASP